MATSPETTPTSASSVSFVLNGEPISIALPDGRQPLSLLDALREQAGVRSVKDGCAPQGQCGCCTVLVDGQPRVSCVTPVTRVAGRDVTTIEGLDDAAGWAETFARHGASQCGFCTPGIIMRVASLDPAARSSPAAVDRALLAHLCRCTGWQTIAEAVADGPHEIEAPTSSSTSTGGPAAGTRDGDAALRARLEGGVDQLVGPAVALGRGGFADDLAPSEALVAMRAVDGSWVVADDVPQARRLSGKVQGRRSTAPVAWPVDVAAGDWAATLQTTWVEPAYLEPDAAWCEPGGEPATPLGNGGAFGGKTDSEVTAVARRLADEHQRPVRVLYSREDVVRRGPKRPPMAIGIGADRTMAIRIGRSGDEDPQLAVLAARSGVAAAGLDPADVEVEVVSVEGPPTSVALRAAVWAEVMVAAHALAADGERDHAVPITIEAPNGARASAAVGDDGVHVEVSCGRPLDTTVLRSYCIGAAHMGLSWVRSESLSLDDDGQPVDLTIRSFGVLRAVDTPPIHVTIDEGDDRDPVNGSDAVFVAVAAATWRAAGCPPRWPITT